MSPGATRSRRTGTPTSLDWRYRMIPDELSYTDQHEWAAVEGDIATVGISDYAQDAVGDVTFVRAAVECTLTSIDSSRSGVCRSISLFRA